MQKLCTEHVSYLSSLHMAHELNNKTVSNIQIWDQLWESGREGRGARAVNLSTSLVLNVGMLDIRTRLLA